MGVKHVGIFLSLAVVACVSETLAADGGNPLLNASKPTDEKTDRAWKRFRSPVQNYCVSYPSRWVKGAAFDGGGIYVETGIKRGSRPIGEIDVGPIEIAPPADARLKPTRLANDSLESDLEEHLAGMHKFAKAQQLEILARNRMTVQGAAALFVKSSYFDPLERRNWIEEIVFVAHEGERYRLELECPPDQLSRFEPVFAYLVNSFELNCK